MKSIYITVIYINFEARVFLCSRSQSFLSQSFREAFCLLLNRLASASFYLCNSLESKPRNVISLDSSPNAGGEIGRKQARWKALAFQDQRTERRVITAYREATATYRRQALAFIFVWRLVVWSWSNKHRPGSTTRFLWSCVALQDRPDVGRAAAASREGEELVERVTSNLWKVRGRVHPWVSHCTPPFRI